MMSLKRIFNFFRRYLVKHPLYVVTYIFTFFLRDFSFKEHLYSREEIQELLRERKSIIRFGDGEINLLLDLKNHYQSFSPKAKSMMKEITCLYKKDSDYILSIPRFINISNEELKKIGKFNVWLPLKVMFLLMFPKNVGYMDAHNFYYDNYFETVIAPVIKDKKIIYVTRKETIEKQKHNSEIPWKDVICVETPEKDALLAYDEIKSKLDKVLDGLSKDEVVLLVAMGPVGKYLVFEYGEFGVQGIDVGVALETMFTGKSLEYLI